ncbi:uncharacterized protein LOC128884376 isoform X2 [Hylaeus volcanicus]|uniref:uncharacterized protein LOC128884376 isoform X2 n=1 Tax=Hylaeus volcanicus TaxID=313075 RepID=UPI0023B7FE61|nr:uncharacterized protein LOC128884376 isoform X2 [Hylaeus volcanicus]
MIVISYLLLLLHAKFSFGITPLKRLILNPHESLKPMNLLTKDLITALNEELFVARNYYDKESGGKRLNHKKVEISRAFQESFLQTKELNTYTNQYLILDHSIVLCDGKDIVKVEEPAFSTFGHAQKTCKESRLCTYFVWKKSSETQRGVVWYCTGTGWMAAQRERGWRVAVKPQWETLPNYDILPNKKIVSESSTKSLVKYGPLSLEDIDFWCNKILCSAFTVSYGSLTKTHEIIKPHPGQKTEFYNELKSRSASSKIIRAKGCLTGIKKNQKVNVNKTKYLNQRVRMQKGNKSNINGMKGNVILQNGPILLNNYSWMGNLGDIVGDPSLGRILIPNTI